MAFGLFSGRLGWVNILLMVVQGVTFLAGAYAAWMFFEAGDAVSQLRWGLPSAVLLILSTMIKMAMWPQHPRRPADARAEADRAAIGPHQAERERLNVTVRPRGSHAPAPFGNRSSRRDLAEAASFRGPAATLVSAERGVRAKPCSTYMR